MSLHARSAVRIPDNTVLSILASAQSTVPVSVVRIRSQQCLSTDDPEGPKFAGPLVAEAAGELMSAEEAADVLGNLVSPYLQAAALAGNAAVDDPQDMLIFSPPTGNGGDGEFVVQRTSHPRSPAPVIRDLPAELFAEMLDALGKHPREDRLHRALAHYRMALSNMAPDNWILAGESLFIAVENLTQVVALRLAREAGLDAAEDWKHRLAVQAGFEPNDETDSKHLYKFESWIREQHVFAGDRTCYKQLLRAGNAFEHGFSGFDHVRDLTSKSAQVAFGYVRRSILREIGIKADSELLDPKYDVPLGDWQPVLEMTGTYTDRALKPGPGFTANDFREEWPDFLGPSVIPRISEVADNPDGSRSIDLTIEGHGNTLRETQTLHLGPEIRWILPQKTIDQVTATPELKLATLNGEDITDRVRPGQPDVSEGSGPAGD